MRTQRFPGGWYADAAVDGRFVVRMPDHLLTSWGRINFPDGEQNFGGLLFPVLDHATGADRIMGQAGIDSPHPNEGAWEWWNRWSQVAPTCKGVIPCIYGKDGTRYVSDAGAAIGSQGFRFLNPQTGLPVTGDESLSPRPGLTLFEWTDLGDGYFVGQGPKDGAWSRGPDGKYRKLIDGACRFIRAHRDGEHVAVACWVERAPSVLLWATLEDLMALPALDEPPPDIPAPSPKPTVPAPPAADEVFPDAHVGFCCYEGAPTPYVGNCAWGAFYAPDESGKRVPVVPSPIPDLLVMEGSRWNASIVGRPFFCGLWTSDGDLIAAEEAAFALSKGASATYLHEDNPSQQRTRTLAAALDVRASGASVVWGLNVNAGVPAEQWPADVIPGITLNIRTHGKDKQRLLEGVVWAVEQLRSGRVKVLIVYGWKDCDWAELKAYLLAVLPRIKAPARYPGQQPAPSPAPTPKDSEPTRVKGGSGSKLTSKQKKIAVGAGAAGGLVAALGKLFGWW